MTKEIKATKSVMRGRPTNPSSARQARLAAKAELLSSGIEIKRGRPVEENSARQARLSLKGTVALGRKVDLTSARQQRLAALELKRTSGVEVKRGRPKMVKTEAE